MMNILHTGNYRFYGLLGLPSSSWAGLPSPPMLGLPSSLHSGGMSAAGVAASDAEESGSSGAAGKAGPTLGALAASFFTTGFLVVLPSFEAGATVRVGASRAATGRAVACAEVGDLVGVRGPLAGGVAPRAGAALEVCAWDRRRVSRTDLITEPDRV